MGKCSAQGAPPAKKAKIDPALAGIQDTLKKAEHLPATCREMLAAMVPASLVTPSEKRSQQQNTVIRWIEDVLKTHQGQLAAEASSVASKLARLEASKAEHLADVSKAASTVTEKS